ncbi:MAG: hypothetical protein JW798_05795 [Prolixibacteraceae bacterium]|nr:hypothetical protein [Prolixibacteraceae bacterium]
MIRISLILILMLSSGYGFAQISEHDLLVIPKEHLLIVHNYNTYTADVEGSPYLDTAFTMGTMVLQGIAYDIPMRYNVLDNVFQVKYKGNQMYIKSEVIDSVVYLNSTYFIKNYEDERKVFEVVKETGKNYLLKNNVVEFIPATIGVPFKENVYAHFEEGKPRYYYSIEGKGLIYLFNFNSLNKYYPGSKKAIKSYVKKNKLKFGDEEDLANLLNFISGLN